MLTACIEVVALLEQDEFHILEMLQTDPGTILLSMPPAQNIVCALGQKSRSDVVNELQDAAPFVRVIGDASRVSTITNAVYWGYHAALDI